MKRPHHQKPSSSTNHRNPNKKPNQKVLEDSGKRPSFISYLEIPNLPAKIKLLCQIMAETPSDSLQKVLEDTGIRVSSRDVEEVLKLCYGYPGSAVKFFKWSAYQLNDSHSPYAWNLVVDLLGKNALFDAMWDAVKSMKNERLISLATFASVFSSYVLADRVSEALMTFEVMDQYGVERDIVGLNSLLSAVCRGGKTEKANEFLGVAKAKIRPDSDTYAILLEGCESEGNVGGARKTFERMVGDIGWDPTNVPAYDSFLCTLIKGKNGFHEAMKFFASMKEKGCYPGVKFYGFALEECARKSDARGASLLWEAMTVRNGVRPDSRMYDLMLSLHCSLNNADIAIKFLDNMVYDGTFPDSHTYNKLFQVLIKCRKLKEASLMFTEMVKNECFPSESNCVDAIRTYLDDGDSYMAIKVWKLMVENYDSKLEEMGNFLVSGLQDNNRLQEAVKYAEDMINRGIRLSSSSLLKFKENLKKAGKMSIYDTLLRKSKAR